MKKHLIVITLLFIFGISQVHARSNMPKSDKVSTEQIKLGKPKSLKLKITGMTCAGCSNHIYNALKAVEGVIEHTVEFPGDLATITYDPDKTNPEAIIKVIEEIGYKAEIISETTPKKKTS